MEAGDDSPTSELPAPPLPPLPERIKRSGKRARDGPLLFGTQLVKHEGKDDELVVEAAPQGAKQSSLRSPRKSSRRRPFRWTRPSSTAPCALLVDASHLPGRVHDLISVCKLSFPHLCNLRT